jgi:hypothetical protein
MLSSGEILATALRIDLVLWRWRDPSGFRDALNSFDGRGLSASYMTAGVYVQDTRRDDVRTQSFRGVSYSRGLEIELQSSLSQKRRHNAFPVCPHPAIARSIISCPPFHSARGVKLEPHT